jgi:hypothetical protein
MPVSLSAGRLAAAGRFDQLHRHRPLLTDESLERTNGCVSAEPLAEVGREPAKHAKKRERDAFSRPFAYFAGSSARTSSVIAPMRPPMVKWQSGMLQ